MNNALVRAKKPATLPMASFAQLQAPARRQYDDNPVVRRLQPMVWRMCKALWQTKEPARYMSALCELVIRSHCADNTHRPADIIASAHNAVSMTRGLQAMIQFLGEDKELRNISILTLPSKMQVATFLLDESVYVNAKAHMNFHAVSLWILARFALSDPKEMPEQSAIFNHQIVNGQVGSWNAYLESILDARFRRA